MRRSCYVVDAFTSEPLHGNSAGVLLDGAGLDAEVMQAIASELKHSETAFPLPSQDPAATFHLRWFTPGNEVAFCGHATIAALHVLAEEAGRIPVHEGRTARIAFTCRSGRLHAELSRDRGALRISVETPDCRMEPMQVPAELLTALGLVPEALDPRMPPQRSTSLEPNLYLAVRDGAALSRCKPDADALRSLGERLSITGFVAFTVAPRDGVDAAQRCFFPGDAIPEDPVTGSAAGQLATLLHTAFPRKSRFTIAQGDELRRPGRIAVEIRTDSFSGKARAWIGGEAVTVLRGELSL